MARMGFGWSNETGKRTIMLYRLPWLPSLLDTVTTTLCRWTKHWSCTMVPGLACLESWVDRQASEFHIPVDDELLAKFCAWMNWDPPHYADDPGETT